MRVPLRIVVYRSRAVVSVVIADDSVHFRRGLRHAIEASDAPIEVVGEAADGAEAAALVERLHPDVVLLDVRMPGCDGITAAETITRSMAGSRMLMLTVSDSTEDIALAARAGAAGYLLKDRSLEDVTDAVVALAGGRTWPLAAG
jgi:DNA-binding NarL/FixJ family response regulator